MSSTLPKVFTFQIGFGAGGNIERLHHSVTLTAESIGEAGTLARSMIPSAEVVKDATVMRLLDDAQAVVWWRPFPPN